MTEQFEPSSGLPVESQTYWSQAVISFLLGLAAEKFLDIRIGTEVGVGLGLIFAGLSYLSYRRTIHS